MTDMPEKIWAFWDYFWSDLKQGDEATEYTRSDLIPQWNSNMDEAPRDSKYILISNGRWIYQAKYGAFVDGQDGWQSRACWAVHDCEDQFYSVLIDDDEPTHWMPLPQPPEPKEQEDG